jgi:hypothetical protein
MRPNPDRTGDSKRPLELRPWGQTNLREVATTEDERKVTLALLNGFLVHAKDQPMWILNRLDLESELGGKMGSKLFKLMTDLDKSTK